MVRYVKKGTIKRRQAAHRAKSGYSKAITRIIRPAPEVKWHAWDDTSTVGTGGSMHNLFTPSHGTTVNDLVGNKATLKNIQIRFTIRRGPVTTPAVVRFTLFRYTEDNAGGPSSNNLFQSSTDLVLQPFNRDHANDFRIIYDKSFSLAGPYNTTDSSDVQIVKDWNFRKIDRGLQYQTNNAAACLKGGLHLHMCASDNVAFNARAMVFFVDA